MAEQRRRHRENRFERKKRDFKCNVSKNVKRPMHDAVCYVYTDYSGEYRDVRYLALLTFQCFEGIFVVKKIDEAHREI